jgi:dipeptidyl aminopeptidase/acylaminoacyl peptidase
MDVERRVPHRISTGVEEYTSLGASADGRRLVATSSHSTARLWRVPLGDVVMHEEDAASVNVPTARSLSPRLASEFMLYRMPKAGTDGLWKLADDKATELWSGAGGRVMGGAAIAPDGHRIAFVTQKRGSLRLNIMNADGSNAHELAEKLDVRGSPAWSPDGRWIAIAASQGGSQRLMKIPVDGGAPLALTADYALDPIWAPSGAFIVYSGEDVGTTFRVKAVTADGNAKTFPNVYLTRGARRMAFRGDNVLVVLKGTITHKEFWELDIQTGRERQLTDLGRAFAIGDFDVSRDGRELVFDRTREESDIEVIDRPVR